MSKPFPTTARAGKFAGLEVAIEKVGEQFMVYPLTPCCHASGKGGESPSGVVCRKCHQPVAGVYGDCEVA
jgi:hypothetical protein